MNRSEAEATLRHWYETQRQLIVFIFGPDSSQSCNGTISYLDDARIRIENYIPCEVEYRSAVVFDLDRAGEKVKSLMLEWASGRRALITCR